MPFQFSWQSEKTTFSDIPTHCSPFIPMTVSITDIFRHLVRPDVQLVGETTACETFALNVILQRIANNRAHILNFPSIFHSFHFDSALFLSNQLKLKGHWARGTLIGWSGSGWCSLSGMKYQACCWQHRWGTAAARGVWNKRTPRQTGCRIYRT